MYNDENNQYNPRPRFDPKTGERIHYDDENTTETTQAESSEYRYSAGNIPFEQENNNTSYYQQSSTFQQDTTYQQAGAGQGSMNQQNGRQKKKKDRNKEGFGERLAKLAGSAAVFGVIAGAVMYGVYYTGSTLLPVKSSSDYNNIATVTSNVTATTAQSTASSSTGMDVQSVANAALPAMVALNGTTTVSSGSSSSFYGLFGGSQSYEAQTSGTGIIVGKNDKELLVVTNAHVVEDVNDLKCVFVDGESVSATVKGSKSDKDIAVVAINLSDIKDSTINSIAIAELADSDDVAIGQEVVAIGNALGEGQSVTTGIISAKDRSITVNNVTFTGLLMTDAAINSGNSGGALLNSEGKVIAINFAKTSSDGVEGMAYSIPVSNVKDIIDSLMTKQTRNKVSSDKAAYLGIAAVDITSNYASYYGYPVGILIRTVADDSAADKAGLETYDIIVGFDDQTVTTMSGLTNMLQYYEAGEKVTIDYYHMEGSEYVLKSTEVTFGSKKAS